MAVFDALVDEALRNQQEGFWPYLVHTVTEKVRRAQEQVDKGQPAGAGTQFPM